MCAMNKIPVRALSLHFGPFPVRSISSSEMASEQKKPSWRVRGILCTSASSFTQKNFSHTQLFVQSALWRDHWSRNRVKGQYLNFEWSCILYTWATCVIISESQRAYAYLNNMLTVCLNIRISTSFYSKNFSTWHPKLQIFKDSLGYQCTSSRDVATQYSICMILGMTTIEKL